MHSIDTRKAESALLYAKYNSSIGAKESSIDNQSKRTG